MAYLYITALAATLLGYAVPALNIFAPFLFYKAFSKKTAGLRNNPFFFSILLFILWLLGVTLYWNNFLGLLAGTFAILPTVLLFLYAGEVLNPKKAESFLVFLVCLSLFAAPIAFFQQYIQGVSIFERVYATFGNANFYASYLLMIIPAAVALAWHAKNKQLRLFFIFTALVNFYCLILTNSRSAFVALFIGFLFFFATTKNYRFLMSTAVLALLIGGVLFLQPQIIPRYNIMPEEFQERISIWSLGWYAITQHPILGTGLTSFYTQYVMNYLGKYAPHAHNLYLNIWVEGGIIALMLLLWNLKKVYKIGLEKLQSKNKILAIGILSGLTAALLQSLLDNPLENFQTGTIFAYFVIILLRI